MVAVVREMNVFHPLQEKLEQFMMNGFTMSPEVRQVCIIYFFEKLYG